MGTTKIEWTERTWNPVTGCDKISAGCLHCYAELMSRRLKSMNLKKYENGFNVAIHHKCLNEPLRWKSPQTIFVCSMSDLFNENVSFDFIDKVFNIIADTPRHTYQILTKRAKRMAEYFSTRDVPMNAWIGVTVEAKNTRKRIDYLREINAAIRFLSCEPLLEDLGVLNLLKIDWVIVGGESGRSARPMKEEWALNIKKQAEANDVSFFFKQWGTWGADGKKRNKIINGKLLQGEVVQNVPTLNFE